MVRDTVLRHAAESDRQAACPAQPQRVESDGQSTRRVAQEREVTPRKSGRVVADRLTGHEHHCANPVGAALGDHERRRGPVVEAHSDVSEVEQFEHLGHQPAWPRKDRSASRRMGRR